VRLRPPTQILESYPETADGGEGLIPDILPWEADCAPGHEPEGEHEAGWEGGQGYGEAAWDASAENVSRGDRALGCNVKTWSYAVE
jgi:hypothetical protein